MPNKCDNELSYNMQTTQLLFHLLYDSESRHSVDIDEFVSGGWSVKLKRCTLILGRKLTQKKLL